MGQHGQTRGDLVRSRNIHRENGIAVQARHFGRNLPPEPKTDLGKARKETSVLWYVRRFHPNNAGKRSGPRACAYVEITHAQVTADARTKNLVWVLVRLHAMRSKKQVVRQALISPACTGN